jgi:energy-coupling factor transport system permease protein
MAAYAPPLTGRTGPRRSGPGGTGSGRLAVYRLARSLHPLAWWLWALGLTVAASRTTNPLLLGAVLGVVSWVVVARRSDAPWANAFRLYLIAGAVVVVLRVLVRIVFGGDQGTHVLVSLPTVALPHVAAGIRLFGDVTAESLLSGLYDGLRLATMVICLGAANALANPRRLLRSMPPALHEVSTAVVVALSVFPQLAESVVRVSRARRLRPASERHRIAAMRSIVIPVLEDALDRSLLLAASMDARGYGRNGERSPRRARAAGVLLVGGLAASASAVSAPRVRECGDRRTDRTDGAWRSSSRPGPDWLPGSWSSSRHRWTRPICIPRCRRWPGRSRPCCRWSRS